MKEVTVVTALDEMRIYSVVVDMVLGKIGTTHEIAERRIDKARVMAKLLAVDMSWDSNTYEFVMRGDEVIPYHVLNYETWEVPDTQERNSPMCAPARYPTITHTGKLRVKHPESAHKLIREWNTEFLLNKKTLRKPSRRQS